jgi:hypothetical protein
MINYLEKNWLTWCYDNPENLVRSNDAQIFKIQHHSQRDSSSTLRESAVAACHSIRETYPAGKFSIMLSGGSESEICLRSFLEAKIPFNVYIGRYENDINLYDVSFAITLCESLGISYTILDFKLQKFLESHAVDYSLYSQQNNSRLLPQLAMCDQVDGIPIMGGGEPYILKVENSNKQKEWVLLISENSLGWFKYFVRQNREAIPYWCQWSPALYQSWMNLPWFQLLIHDKLHGNAASNKISGYQKQFPELLTRMKKTGFEKVENLFDEVNLHLQTIMPSEQLYKYSIEGFFENKIHSQEKYFGKASRFY